MYFSFPSSTSLLGDGLSIGADTKSVEFRNVLRPHLGKLIPRILRGCHDPNKQTKEQMTSLWRGLTGGGAEGRRAISLHLTSTIDSLLRDCSSKLWRARVGAWYVHLV
jgi:proteasome component ECM29